MLYSTTINYSEWSNNENSAQNNNTLFVTLLLLLLLLLIVIYNCDGTYVEGNDNSGLVCWSIMVSIYLLNLLSCPCQSVPTRIITTHFFQAYTYNWVMILIVLYDGIMIEQSTDDHSIRDYVTNSIVCWVR